MEAIYASETPDSPRTTLYENPKVHTLHSYRTENLKSNLLWNADPLLGNYRLISSNNSRYWIAASQTNMFSRQQLNYN
jgi:hypothetical protein